MARLLCSSRWRYRLRRRLGLRMRRMPFRCTRRLISRRRQLLCTQAPSNSPPTDRHATSHTGCRPSGAVPAWSIPGNHPGPAPGGRTSDRSTPNPPGTGWHRKACRPDRPSPGTSDPATPADAPGSPAAASRPDTAVTTTRNCSGPNAEGPNAFAGSRVATATFESSSVMPPLVSVRVVENVFIHRGHLDLLIEREHRRRQRPHRESQARILRQLVLIAELDVAVAARRTTARRSCRAASHSAAGAATSVLRASTRPSFSMALALDDIALFEGGGGRRVLRHHGELVGGLMGRQGTGHELHTLHIQARDLHPGGFP